MKGLAVVLVFGLCALAYCRPEEKYTTKYDNVNLDDIIKNDRLMKNYVDCVLGKRKCTKDGEELKKNLPDALQNGCSKCSEAQQNGSRKIIHHLIKNKPEWWKELEAKYDPAGSYRTKYAEEIKKEGLTL